MRTFKDASGQEWNLLLTVGELKRLRSINVDLCDLEAGQPSLATRLCGDAVLLGDVLFCLVAKQAEELGVTAEQFARRLAGAALESGSVALWQAAADFFDRWRPSLAAACQSLASANQMPAGSGDTSTDSPVQPG